MIRHKLTWTEVNALTRNISRAVTALEDDDREIELMEMKAYLDYAILSIRTARSQSHARNLV